jgi:uncharacterized protein YjdB
MYFPLAKHLRSTIPQACTVLALFLLLIPVGCGDFFVAPGAIVSITISPNNPTIQPGKTQQFTANAILGDSTSKDVTSQTTWTSSNPSVATIDNSGLATAVAVGTTTITATSGGITATTTLTVSNQVITSIAVTPATATLIIGQTQQLTATATLSDNTTSNVTNSVTWSSSNPAVATVTNTGLATAISTGTATITASAGTVTGTSTITVF